MQSTAERIYIESEQENTSNNEFYLDVVEGLSKEQKTLPCKYFYDDYGSQLFEKICELDEYYITRTENSILKSINNELAEWIGPGARIIEPGSGNSEKVRPILNSLIEPQAYMPIEISEEILMLSVDALRKDFPTISIDPWAGDFHEAIDQIKQKDYNTSSNNVIFFPGSTIGNLSHAQAEAFLLTIRKELGEDISMVIGVDLIKDKNRLEAAYNDKEGVTAEFNLNLLKRINQELSANFDLKKFTHKSLYNEAMQRIEMHLFSQIDQNVTIEDKHFSFKAGESIHTENSHKYSVESFKNLANASGFDIKKTWLDDEELFSVHYLKAQPLNAIDRK